jgi:hypothetical protein
MIVCFCVWVPMSDTVTTFALRDQEKLDHLGSSAADYLTAQVLGR